MNMVEVTTRIEGLATQRDKLLSSASDLLFNAIILRIGDSKTTNLKKEIDNILSSFSLEERYAIVVKTLTKMASNTKLSNSDSNKSDDDSNYLSAFKTSKKKRSIIDFE